MDDSAVEAIQPDRGPNALARIANMPRQPTTRYLTIATSLRKAFTVKRLEGTVQICIGQFSSGYGHFKPGSSPVLESWPGNPLTYKSLERVPYPFR
jgi:hypothetical protein